MKRFSKILTLLLATAVILTAFAVVALATEPLPDPVVKYEDNFDSYEIGVYLGDNNKKVGWFETAGQEGNTNKYLVHYGKPHSGTNATSFLGGVLYSYGTSKQLTNIVDYPYAAFEFDIMKPTDSYSTFSFGTYIKDQSGNIKPINVSVKSSSIAQFFPSEKYVWARGTVIFKYHSETADNVKTGYLSIYLYVNGKEAYKSEKAGKFVYNTEGLYSGKAENELYLTDFRFDTSSTGNTNSTNKTIIDNAKLKVYQSVYGIDDIVSAAYPEGYTFPYTKTRALFNGVGYENVSEAIAKANEGDTVILRDNADNVMIDKAITIDANIYDENGAATGNYYAVNWDTDKNFAAAVENGKYTFISTDADTGYDIEVISDGKSVYYKDVDFHNAVANAPAGALVKLHGDVDTNCGNIKVSRTVTIDLNGYDIRRVFECGIKYEALANGDGTYTYSTSTELERINLSADTDVRKISSTGLNLFTVLENDTVFTITSSREGSEIYAVVMNVNTWYTAEGEKLDHTKTTFRTSNLCSIPGDTVNEFNLSNVTVYSTMLLAQTGTSATITVNIDNIKHFAMRPTAGDTYIYYYFQTFSFVNKLSVKFNATNSLFYNHVSNELIRSFSGSVTETKLFITFTNCDIIKDNDTYTTGIINALASGMTHRAKILFSNCRILDTGAPAGAYVSHGTYASIMNYVTNPTVCPAADEGFERVSIPNHIVSYVVPTVTNFTLDPNSTLPMPSFTYATKPLSIKYNTVATKAVNVTWIKDGEVYKTETLYPGKDSFEGHVFRIVLENDSYRDAVYQWVNAEGKVSDAQFYWDAEQVYTATEKVDGKYKYIAGLKDAMMNLSYLGHFAYNLYAPVVEGVTVNKIGDYAPGKAMIDGREYYVSNAGWISPAELLTPQTKKYVNYTIDGVSYSVEFTLDITLYIEQLFKNPATTAQEKDTVIKLMAYSEEVYKLKGLLTEENKAKFDAFFTEYSEGNRPAYVSEYPVSEIHTVDETFSTYVKSFGFAIYTSLNRMSFVATINADAAAAGYKLTVNGISNGFESKTVNNSDGSVSYYTDNTHVSRIIRAVIVVSVLDSSGKVVASTNYSFATYAKSIDSNAEGANVVYSFYTFAKSAAKTREYLSTL